MSLSSKSTEPYTAYPSTEVPFTSSIGVSGPNRSPEQAAELFEMPLFPGHVKAGYGPAVKAKPKMPHQASEMAALMQQQVNLAEALKEQTKRFQADIAGLKQQLTQQAQQHQAEMRQVSKTWHQQFATFTSAATVQPSVGSHQADAAVLQRKTMLSHIPTTYEVPQRTQVKWLDNLLGAVPAFVWLVVLGIAIAGVCVIALPQAGLAPAGLLASMNPFINSAIAIIFVLGVLSLSITAVWDSFR